jgi:hypothetical protein
MAGEGLEGALQDLRGGGSAGSGGGWVAGAVGWPGRGWVLEMLATVAGVAGGRVHGVLLLFTHKQAARCPAGGDAWRTGCRSQSSSRATMQQ